MVRAEFDDAVAELQGAATTKQGLEGLRSVRALLIDQTFKQQLAEIIERAHNQPKERAAMLQALARMKFAFADQRTERGERHFQTSLVSIGGGVALGTGAILAVATQLLITPWMVLVPLSIGAYFAWQGMATNERLALETSILNDIVGALDDLVRAVKRDD